MGSKIEYAEGVAVAASDYARNSKAVGVLWATFSVCYCVLCAAALLANEWIGHGDGRAGVWQVCSTEASGNEACVGKLESPGSLPIVFRVTTVLVALATGLSMVAAVAMLLALMCRPTAVFRVCGWLQLLSAIALALGVGLYPAAWNESRIRDICGPAADQYKLGDCGVRWAYVVAALSALDGGVLAALAFLLAARHLRLHPDYSHSELVRGEVNNAYVCEGGSVVSGGGGRKLALQPVLLVRGDPDTYSQYSRRPPHAHH